ncbi:HAD family hydrolase [Gluconobacter kondonii]|nr:HAD family hydrolase [Gluconobacter kondonii]
MAHELVPSPNCRVNISMSVTAQHDLKPAAFLDRDGVLNVDVGYPHRIEEFAFIPGAPEAVARLNRLGYRVIVVSNQSGVARGLFTEYTVKHFHQHMQEQLAQMQAHIDAFYFCPYHPDATVEQYRADHPDRKPNPGMIERAIVDMKIDRSLSFMIGDRESDMAAASAAGIPGYLFEGGNLLAYLTMIEPILSFVKI